MAPGRATGKAMAIPGKRVYTAFLRIAINFSSKIYRLEAEVKRFFRVPLIVSC
jgi:hypothetical protein